MCIIVDILAREWFSQKNKKRSHQLEVQAWGTVARNKDKSGIGPKKCLSRSFLLFSDFISHWSQTSFPLLICITSPISREVWLPELEDCFL